MTTHRQIDSIVPPTVRPSTRSMTLAAVALAGLGACTSPGAGDGKTYVLVHGAWMGSAGWGPVADRLRDEGAEVRTLDLPAHGGDVTAPSAATLGGYVDRVSAELDAAGSRVILVAHSMGGVVISQAADRKPDQVESVVYIAAYVPVNGKSLLDIAMTDADSQVGPNL
jgi:pimeloyl-ACP methyl ester carboxylesterase